MTKCSDYLGELIILCNLEDKRCKLSQNSKWCSLDVIIFVPAHVSGSNQNYIFAEEMLKLCIGKPTKSNVLRRSMVCNWPPGLEPTILEPLCVLKV